jgi:hypothetical protein
VPIGQGAKAALPLAQSGVVDGVDERVQGRLDGGGHGRPSLVEDGDDEGAVTPLQPPEEHLVDGDQPLLPSPNVGRQ